MPRAKGSPVDRLSKLTLRLIKNDLKRIEALMKSGYKKLVPGLYAPTLSRYHSALTNQKKLTDKFEDEQRKRLKKMSVKQLQDIAGVVPKKKNEPSKPISDKEVSKAPEDLDKKTS